MSRRYDRRSNVLCSTGAPSAPMTQRLDHQGEGRRRLAAARIVKVVAGEGWAPVGQHADEPSVGEMRLHHVIRHVCQSEAGEGRVEPQAQAVEHPLSLDPDLQLAPALLELPRIESAGGRQTE